MFSLLGHIACSSQRGVSLHKTVDQQIALRLQLDDRLHSRGADDCFRIHKQSQCHDHHSNQLSHGVSPRYCVDT